MTGGATRASGISVPLSSWDLIVCTVRTASGVTGTGFTYALRVGGEATLAALRDDLAPLVIGADCWATEELWDRLYWATLLRRPARPPDPRPQRPRHRALGLQGALGRPAARAPARAPSAARSQAYESSSGWLSLPLDELVRGAVRVGREGFTAFKVIVGSPDAREDVRARRGGAPAIGPEPTVMVDAGQKWNLRTALDCHPALRRARRLLDRGARQRG